MKKQIIHISPAQTAKVFAVLYFVMSFPLVALMSISYMLSPASAAMGFGFLVLMPFAYLIFGFIFTAIGAWVYNLVAKWVGGVEYTTSESY